MLNDVFMPLLTFISAPLFYTYLKWHFYKEKIILKQELGFGLIKGIILFVFFWGISMGLAWSFIEIFMLALMWSIVLPGLNEKQPKA